MGDSIKDDVVKDTVVDEEIAKEISSVHTPKDDAALDEDLMLEMTRSRC
jgi:hypothetical protein